MKRNAYTEKDWPHHKTVFPSSSSINKFRSRLLKWYKSNGRHFPWRNKSASIYKVIVAEILLQRTRAETVEVFYRDFIRLFPSWKRS